MLNRKYIFFIAFLIMVNSTLFLFRDKLRIKKFSSTYKLKYGSTVSSLRKQLNIHNKKYIAVLLLMHPFIDYSRELIRANLLKEKSNHEIYIFPITYNNYQYLDRVQGNKLNFIIDNKKNIISQLGNLGKARFKVVIIKNDSVIYCNHVGLNIIAEAGGIIKQYYKFKQDRSVKGNLTNLQRTKIQAFKELKYGYYIFYNSICTKCQGGVLLETIANSQTYKNNCGIIFSSFNNAKDISAFLVKNKFNSLHSYIADSSFNPWFDLDREPAIYQKNHSNIRKITEIFFLHKKKE